eukprot:m.1642772 g.1642772  ORF g.1642772 m.1642772 type:complete len:87 (+) comp54948_c0_seq1:962-1222(+)
MSCMWAVRSCGRNQETLTVWGNAVAGSYFSWEMRRCLADADAMICAHSSPMQGIAAVWFHARNFYSGGPHEVTTTVDLVRGEPGTF